MEKVLGTKTTVLQDGQILKTLLQRLLRTKKNIIGSHDWKGDLELLNILSINLKLTLQGGDRYSPIDREATMNHPDKEVQYDETKAFSKQYSPMLIGNYTVSYRINKKKVSHEFAVKERLDRCQEYLGKRFELCVP